MESEGARRQRLGWFDPVAAAAVFGVGVMVGLAISEWLPATGRPLAGVVGCVATGDGDPFPSRRGPTDAATDVGLRPKASPEHPRPL